MTDRTGEEPGISRADNAPMLGGDRAMKFCPVCGTRQQVDMFGNWACPTCSSSIRKQTVNLIRRPLSTDPDWFRAGKTVPKTHIANVRLGRHPLGLPLHKDETLRCRDCRYFTRHRWENLTYFKCGLMEWTRGPGTDIRAGWHACQLFKRSEDT